MANYLKNEGPMLSEDRREMTPARRRKIREHRQWADKYGPELPYQIGGSLGPKIHSGPRNEELECKGCGRAIFIAKTTFAVICSHCKELNVVK